MIPESERFGFSGIDRTLRSEAVCCKAEICLGMNGSDALRGYLGKREGKDGGTIAHGDRVNNDAKFFCADFHLRPSPISKFSALLGVNVGLCTLDSGGTLISSQLQAGNRSDYGCNCSYKADGIGRYPFEHESILSIFLDDTIAITPLNHSQPLDGSVSFSEVANAATHCSFEQWLSRWRGRMMCALTNDAGDLIAVPEFTRCNVSRFAGRTPASRSIKSRVEVSHG